MQKRILIIASFSMFLAPAFVTAQEPWGEIKAFPNPCRIEAGRDECTTHLVWHTRGVERAKVFVTAKGRKEFKEREFSNSRECEGEKCSAPWITHHNTYTFQLFDFTRGDRGRMLAEVVVRGEQ